MPAIDERLIVECSYRILAALLESLTEVWIGPFATIATEQAEWSRVGGYRSPDTRSGDRSVFASVAADRAAVLPTGGIAVPVEWSTDGYASVFRTFSGELSARGIDGRLTELRLSGEYISPRAADASAVAARRLLAHLRAAVEELAREAARPHVARLARRPDGYGSVEASSSALGTV